MNERIKELWNYAADTTKDDSWESQSAFIEEFAELIIRECAEFCENKNSKLLGTMLKEHFGVEE